jgi:DNA-binding IclR family transcriptional regulator
MSNQGLLIQSLEKGLMVLNTFRDHESLNLQEISRHCGITMGSAQRVAHTLEQAGYLRRDPRGKRYRVTVKAVGLGYNYLHRDPLFQRAHAVLHQINQQCGEIVNLSVPDDDDMIFVMRVAPARHVPFYLPTGTRIPCFASASGRAVWSHLPEDELQSRLDGLVACKHTPHTTTDAGQLLQFIGQARENRYAHAEDEFFVGDINVAAAVLDGDGRPAAAVNISVPKPRWSLARARDELAPLVIQAARAIGRP